MRINKKGGIIGSFFGLFVMTIIVVIILLIFILGSGIVKKINKVESGVVVVDEAGVEIDNVFDYIGRYGDLIEARFLIERGLVVNDALMEVDYEE